MKTYITTAHEEQYSDNSRILGVLLNFDGNSNRVDSLLYIYHKKNSMYIFFNTIIDMNDYLLYADNKTRRAYISEEDFDSYYDSKYINGKFSENIEWLEE